jgi:hypothetical protein
MQISGMRGAELPRPAVEGVSSGTANKRSAGAPSEGRPGRVLRLSAAELGRGGFAPQLEAGRVLALHDLPYTPLPPALFESRGDRSAKNISFDPNSGALKGQRPDEALDAALREVLAAYAAWAASLLRLAAPAYAGLLQAGKASFRPRPAEQPLGGRKDDRRLHVDAFPSQPARGRRILRVFRNVHPEGEPRIWHLGEPFAEHARRFLPATRGLRPGEAALLRRLGLTKARRTDYDQRMLGLHDAAKACDSYQRDAAREVVAFAPDTTWILFSDAIPHAALSGRYALEQTFFLPVSAMRDEAASPLRILEAMSGSRLA